MARSARLLAGGPGQPRTPGADWSPEECRRSVLALSCAFLALFAGFNAAQGLQSSLNGALGFLNLAVLYGTFSVCCVAAPAVIKALERRGRSIRPPLVVGGMFYVGMVLVNMLTVPEATRPAHVWVVAANIFLNFLVGLGAPLLWTIQNVYVGRCALAAAHHEDAVGGDVTTRTTSAFNGLFFTFFQFAGALGTAASSLVMLLGTGEGSRATLFLVLACLSLLGTLGFLVLPPMPPATASQPTATEEEVRFLCVETLRLAASDSRMSLLVPLIFANGCFLSFTFADYQRSFVSAVVGPQCAGLSLLTFYLSNAAASAAWGVLIHRGRLRVWTVLVIAFLLQLGVLSVLLISKLRWLPLFAEHYKFNASGGSRVRSHWTLTDLGPPACWEFLAPFVCAALAAVGDAAYESQPPAVLQVFFHDERVVAAMSNYKLWQSFGFSAQFVAGVLVTSVVVRVAVLALILCASFACLAALDRRVAPVSGAGSGTAAAGPI